MQKSDLVIVGHVLGLADRKPAAQSRRAREVHRIEVEQTLKGYEMRGQELSVRPNSLTWEDGGSYLFFLTPEIPAGSMTQALPSQPILEATTASINEVADIVAAQGGGVSPRLVLWVTEDSGFGPVRKLIVVETGEVRWWGNAQGASEERAGTLSRSDTETLLSVIAEMTPQIPPDDAAIVAFNWLDTDLLVHTKVVAADHPDAGALLRLIETLLKIN